MTVTGAMENEDEEPTGTRHERRMETYRKEKRMWLFSTAGNTDSRFASERMSLNERR